MYCSSHVLATALLVVITSLKLCSIVFLCVYTLNNAHAMSHLTQEIEELHYEIDTSDLYKKPMYVADVPIK